MEVSSTLRSTGLIFYALLCLAFMAGYLGAFVRPTPLLWWLQLPSAVLPQISLVLLVITPLLFIPPLKASAAIQGLLLFLMLIRFAPAPSVLKPGPQDSPTLRVMTFNVKEVDQRIHPETALQEIIEDHKPDILATQGGALIFRRQIPRSERRALRKLVEERKYVTAPPENLPGTVFFVPIFVENVGGSARLRAGSQEVFSLSTADQRLMSRAEIQWDGQTFAVYNIHLHSFSMKPWRWSRSILANYETWKEIIRTVRNDYIERAEQSEVVRELIEQEVLPFIICGDFNSSPHDWSYRRIAAGLKDVQSHGRIRRVPTYHARRPFVRIDHILVSEHWQVHEVRTLPRTFSDHLPLMAEVSLR